MDLYATADAVITGEKPEILSKLEADCELVMIEFHKGNTLVPVSIIYADRESVPAFNIGWIARIRNRINEHLADANQKVRCRTPSSHRGSVGAFKFEMPE